MTDNKKPTNEEIKNKKTYNEELTDEQANEVAGGNGNYYTCTCCHKTFFGRPFSFNGKSYCAKCVPKTRLI